MTDEQKQTFIDEYNATELLHDTTLIDEDVYRKIEHRLLRTIIGHWAIDKMLEIQADKAEGSNKECDTCYHGGELFLGYGDSSYNPCDGCKENGYKNYKKEE